jgi:hypothetical protein
MGIVITTGDYTLLVDSRSDESGRRPVNRNYLNVRNGLLYRRHDDDGWEGIDLSLSARFRINRHMRDAINAVWDKFIDLAQADSDEPVFDVPEFGKMTKPDLLRRAPRTLKEDHFLTHIVPTLCPWMRPQPTPPPFEDIFES